METPKNRNWKVLKSEYLSSQPWFTVRREEVELPNGNRIPEYYIFEYPEWINVIAITKEQKFVFVSQYRDGNRRQSEHPHQPDLLLSCHRCRVSHGTTSGRHGRPQRPPSDSRRSKRITSKRSNQTSAPRRPTLEIHGDESFDLRNQNGWHSRQ